MTFEGAIPVLRISSEEKAREFYVDFLGFTVDFEHRFEPDLPLFLQVSRSKLTLQLSEHFGDGTPGSAVFVPMQGIDALHAELTAKRYRHARPGVEMQPWGRELTVSDPFGNRLCFCERTTKE